MYGRIQAIDELEMCVSRLRFPLPYEQDIDAKLNVVRPYEVGLLMIFLECFKNLNLKQNTIQSSTIETGCPNKKVLLLF